MRRISILFLISPFFFAGTPAEAQNVLVLGVAQDGGYPHIGCRKECCSAAWKTDSVRRMVVSLALVDSVAKKWWLIEATPDMHKQLNLFDSLTQHKYPYLPEAIFITHAHIGHYLGLAQLGREAMNSNNIPVYCMPKMKLFLENNGPWSQLVLLHNISIREMHADSSVNLSDSIKIMPWLVPHRDEFSETAGFKIQSQSKQYLFIPDIDKWEKWGRNICDEIKKCDIAFLDATFFSESELPGRRMSEVPHPFVKESIELFSKNNILPEKVVFIHFNHTNPMMWNPASISSKEIRYFRLAAQGKWY